MTMNDRRHRNDPAHNNGTAQKLGWLTSKRPLMGAGSTEGTEHSYTRTFSAPANGRLGDATETASRPSLLVRCVASARSTLGATSAALALVAAGSWQPAQALLTYNIFENEGDVVVETNGTLSLGEPLENRLLGCGRDGGISSEFAVVCTGLYSVNFPAYGLTGPGSFNGSVSQFPASSVSGIATILYAAVGQFTIDSSYVSGSPIVSSATFNNTTLVDLGFTTTGLIGTWTLNDGGDQIQVVLGAPAEVPGPLPLLGAGAAFGFSRRLRRRISASQVARPQG